MQYVRNRAGNLATAFALIGLVACGPSEEVQRQLSELQAVSAEKDSLLAQVTDNALLMSEIGAELAKAQAPATAAGSQEVSAPPDRDVILASIRDLSARVDDSETRLAESQKRIQQLTREATTREGRLAEFQKTIDDFQTAIDNQRRTIASLTEQVNNLRIENVQLAMHNTELTETVDRMEMRENTAYYIVGTKDELIEQGIITEEGGSRVLFVFGKRGKTLVPGRDINLDLLNRINKSDVRYIPLPDPGAEYRIVSLQDLSALENQPDSDGRFSGESLAIADTERFWANSTVLIVVQT